MRQTTTSNSVTALHSDKVRGGKEILKKPDSLRQGALVIFLYIYIYKALAREGQQSKAMEERNKTAVTVDKGQMYELLQSMIEVQKAMLSAKARASRHFFQPIGAEGDELAGTDPSSDAFFELDEIERERQLRIEKEADRRGFEGLIVITLFCFICLALITAYVGICWLNFTLIFGYPAIAAPPSPGPFVNQRYTFQYFCVYLLGINFLPPLCLMIAANIPNQISGKFLHQIVTILAFVVNVFSGIFLVLLYWWFCNGSNATMSVLANDVSWCCVHFASAPVLCPIAPTGCIPGSPTTRAELSVPLEYTLSMVAALVFFLLTWGHLQINAKFRRWNIWRTAL